MKEKPQNKLVTV